MANIARHITGLFTSLFSIPRLIGITKKDILLPFYHTVSDQHLSHISNLYQLRDAKLFEQDLDFFCKHYTPITSDELIAIIHHDKKLQKPVFHLTFDDGLSEIYDVIAPILERKKIPATFFVNTAFVDNKGLFYRYKISLIIERIKYEKVNLEELSRKLKTGEKQKNIINALLQLTYQDIPLIDEIAKLIQLDFQAFLQEQKPYMSTVQLLDLQKRGFTIASHGTDHPWFKTLPEENQKRQIIESTAFLEQQLAIKSHMFSFPFSDEGVSGSFINWLHIEAKNKLTFGVFGLKDEVSKYHLHRIPIERQLAKASNIIKTEYLYYIAKQFVSKNTIQRND